MLPTKPLLLLILITFNTFRPCISNQAYCVLHNPSFKEIIGTIQFIQPDPQTPTTIILEFSNLPPGTHGFHLNRACNLPPQHFDPEGPHHHGAPTDQDRHAGDLGNIEVEPDGTAAITFNDSVITLFGPNSIVGAGCIIHDWADDFGKSGHSDSLVNGHAGSSLTCGEIIEGDVVTALREEAEIQAQAHANQVAASLAIAALIVQQAFNTGTLAVAATLMAANILQYVRFINIQYPKQLETLYRIQGIKPLNLNFGPLFPQNLKPTARQYVPPPRFAKYQISSLMIVNYWRSIITAPILISIATLVLLLGFLLKFNPYLRKGAIWARDFMIFNFLICFFLSNIDSLILWSILEFRTLRLDSGLAKASFAINVLLICSGISLLMFITAKIFILKKRERNLPLEQQLERHSSIKVVFEEVNDRRLLQELFLVILAFRIILNNVILAAVDNPQIQCIFLLCTTIATMIYLVVFRPCRALWKNFELFSYEILTLIVNVACVRLSFVALGYNEAIQKQGQTIQNTTLAVTWMALFFALVDVLVLLYQFVRKRKICKLRKKKEEETQECGQQSQPKECQCLDIEERGPSGSDTMANRDDFPPEKVTTIDVYVESEFVTKPQPREGKCLKYLNIEEQGPSGSDVMENNSDVLPEKISLSDIHLDLELSEKADPKEEKCLEIEDRQGAIESNQDDIPSEKVITLDELGLCTVQSRQTSTTGLLS